MLHNFVFSLWPDAHWLLPTSAMQPETPAAPTYAYVVPFEFSAGDSYYDVRSRLTLFEDGRPLTNHTELPVIRSLGQGLFAHQDGRLIFSSLDGTDPRTNGHDYDAYYPIFYGRTIGYVATFVFFAAVGALYFVTGRHDGRSERPGAAARPYPRKTFPYRLGSFRWHILGSALLLLLGLYCSTGTLAPYAIYNLTHQEPHNDYLYNVDHPHFKVLFQFLDGEPRSVWNGAILLRRILFPALAYPFMKIWGFEIGGTIASLVFSVAGFLCFVIFLRSTVGEKGAVFAGWLLALYPGAAYWAGLPYIYAIIFPASLLLTAALLALDGSDDQWQLALISVGMGVLYLGYDLFAFFLPASVVLLCWRRRPVGALLSPVLQALPLFCWATILSHRFHQPLTNSNSEAFGAVLTSYLHVHDYALWWEVAKTAPAIGFNVFFGANFLFLPTLFVLLLLFNALTSRISFHPVELCLLGAGAAIFLFNNLAPPYAAPWVLRGEPYARLYQPVFPALILFAARWFQALPPLTPRLRLGIGAAILACGVGNLLIIFGPILDNPWGISETAFYAFTTSGQSHAVYEGNLERYGRRPLGFHVSPTSPAP